MFDLCWWPVPNTIRNRNIIQQKRVLILLYTLCLKPPQCTCRWTLSLYIPHGHVPVHCLIRSTLNVDRSTHLAVVLLAGHCGGIVKLQKPEHRDIPAPFDAGRMYYISRVSSGVNTASHNCARSACRMHESANEYRRQGMAGVMVPLTCKG